MSTLNGLYVFVHDPHYHFMWVMDCCMLAISEE